MLCACARLVFVYLALCTVAVLAAVDEKTKLGNRTIERTVQLRTHSLFAPYIDQDLQNRWWDFGGDAYVNTNKHIRLTQSKRSQSGWLWSRLPITAANFVIEVEFKISGDPTHLFGDGLAMWLTEQRAQSGPVFGSPDKFDGVGIFIDTYANSRHSYSFPRIMVIKGDGSTPYDLEHDGETQSLAACSANVRRTNVATKLRLTYVKNDFLDVKIQYKAWDDWTDCFLLKGISLPPAPFLGFSAATGDVHDAHDIIAVTTSSAILSAADKPRDRLKTAAGSTVVETVTFPGTILKILLFVGLCAGAFYGYKYYREHHSSNDFGSRGGLGNGDGYAMGRGASYNDAYYGNAKRF